MNKFLSFAFVMALATSLTSCCCENQDPCCEQTVPRPRCCEPRPCAPKPCCPPRCETHYFENNNNCCY